MGGKHPTHDKAMVSGGYGVVRGQVDHLSMGAGRPDMVTVSLMGPSSEGSSYYWFDITAGEVTVKDVGHVTRVVDIGELTRWFLAQKQGVKVELHPLLTRYGTAQEVHFEPADPKTFDVVNRSTRIES
jgi:hypothetical protein